MRFFLLHQTLTTMSLFAVNNQKPPKPWKIISWFGSSSSGLGDKGGKAPAQRKESPADPKDIQRAKRLNERFTAFKKQLGAYYRAYALKSVYGIQIKKYVPAQLGGVDSDKFRPVSNGQSVIDKMLQKRFGISLKQFEEKTITELRKIFGKAESTPAPKKAEKKAEPKKVEKKDTTTPILKTGRKYGAFDFAGYTGDANEMHNGKMLEKEIKKLVTTTKFDSETPNVLHAIYRKYSFEVLDNGSEFKVNFDKTDGQYPAVIDMNDTEKPLTFKQLAKKIVGGMDWLIKDSKKAEKPTPKPTPTPKPAPKKAETVPPIKKVEPAPAPVPKTEAPSEEEGIKQLDEIKALITSAIQNKKAA